MGKVTGFLEYQRLQEAAEAPEARKKHWREFVAHLTDGDATVQGARCMDCGIPFCMSGCPVNNIIPDFNDLVYRQDWKRAIETLHSTNNFPEFTGRVCPAPCEEACTLRHQQRPGRHQVDRARDHRQGLGRGLGPAAAARAQDRQEGRGHRLGSRRPRLRTATRPRRARRRRVREERSRGRPAPLRHSRLQDGEVADRPPARADACRGCRVPHRRVRRESAARKRDRERREEDHWPRATHRPVRRGGPLRRGRAAARPPDPGARPRWRPLRDGFPPAAEPARRRRQRHSRAAGRPASTSS